MFERETGASETFAEQGLATGIVRRQRTSPDQFAGQIKNCAHS
jgi:hypothetical protein